LTSGAVQALR